MFFKYTVPVPVAAGKISRQKTKSGTYILYVISRQYDPAKKHTVPVRAMIGKVSDEEGVRGHYLLTHFWTDKVTLTVESGAFS